MSDIKETNLCNTCAGQHYHATSCQIKQSKGLVTECSYYAENRAGDPQTDNVNHPSHYTKGGIECIKAIWASMPEHEYRGYLKGNILKYLWRYENKNGLEDLKKAKWYLEELIKNMEIDNG